MTENTMYCLTKLRHAPLMVGAIALLIVLSGCSKEQEQPRMVPLVSTVKVVPERAAITSDLPGRVAPVREAQIRARVTGIVQKIEFKQGGDVKEGQLLFKIDPAQYQASYEQAAAQLKRAQADAYAANLLAKRYAPLVKANAISKQEFDNAQASARQADAVVAGAKAALDSAAINLGYTSVTSPITGRIGRPLVTEGALVEGSVATQMAVVQQLSPIYVDLNQSTAELARLRKMFKDGSLQKVAEDAAKVVVILEDGSTYPEPARLLFTGISVNEGTGQVTLRTEVQNPDQVLLPGMFVRVRIDQGIDDNAILIPAQALQRGADGKNSVMVVKDSKVAVAPVALGPNHEGRVLITQGLKADDEVIVEGFQKVRPGVPVKAVPWKLDPAAKK